VVVVVAFGFVPTGLGCPGIGFGPPPVGFVVFVPTGLGCPGIGDSSLPLAKNPFDSEGKVKSATNSEPRISFDESTEIVYISSPYIRSHTFKVVRFFLI
jgi:hypothetical protein